MYMDPPGLGTPEPWFILKSPNHTVTPGEASYTRTRSSNTKEAHDQRLNSVLLWQIPSCPHISPLKLIKKFLLLYFLEISFPGK